MLLVAYVTFSGGNPSMIRAAVMASIAAVGQLAGRQRLARHILFISATAMLIVNPLWLLDTSFQLSVAATAGIIEIEPLISTMLHKLPRIIRETTSTTLAAQLATLPIIAATFGQISVFGSIANLLILWTVPWVMLTGIIYIPITLAAPGVSWLLIWAVEPALWYIKHIVEIAANLPLAAANIHMTFLFAALYYLALLLIKGSVSHVSVSTIKN
jgi:competence protein ComEC